MASGDRIPLRALPRLFVPGASPERPIDLPKEEVDKFRKVLRLNAGAHIAVLPNDGTIVRCEFQNHVAIPLSVERPETEAAMKLTVCQSLPKGDKLDEIVRACTELGVSRFLLFQSERTIVQWDAKKVQSRLDRLRTISREACEVSFRTNLPTFDFAKDLKDVLAREPDAVALSEVDSVARTLPKNVQQLSMVVGPEGGWSNAEVKLIGDRAVTLGPRVLRVDHAAAAAASILLLTH